MKTTNLGPERQIPRPDINPTDQRNRDTRHSIAKAIRRPVQRAIPKGNGMELPEGPVLGEALEEEIQHHGDDNTERESEEELLVLALMTKHLDRTDGAPEDRGREEGVWTGAVETHGGILLADVFDVDLEVDYACADKG